MNRRAFVGRTATAASSLLIGDYWLLARRAMAADCAQRAPGVQLFTLRDPLQHDPRAALAAVSALGLKEVELFGLPVSDDPQLFGMQPGDFKALLEQNGLSAPMSHIDGTLTSLSTVAELAHRLDVAALVVALPTEFTQMRDNRFTMVGAKDVAQLDRLAERLNRAGEELGRQGLTFAYHNHHVEFIPVEGRIPFDYLMANTDPDLVKIELDLGWLALAGVDSVEYVSRYGGRILACHLKDFKPAATGAADAQTQLVEPGAGTIDFARVLDAMDEAQVPHAFIEIDRSADPLAAVERGHRHLQRLRDC